MAHETENVDDFGTGQYVDKHLDIIVDSMSKESVANFANSVNAYQQVGYTVFEPGGDPTLEYEELNDYPEIKALSKDEYAFCWYYASETSVYKEVENKRNKVFACIANSFKDKVTGADYEKLINLQFPERYMLAMKRIKGFNGTARMRAKAMMYVALRNLEVMLNVPSDMIEAYGPDESKKYSDMVKSTLPVIDEILRKLESGYGVKTKTIIDRDFSKSNIMQKVISSMQ